jgi:hypothetical protein
MLSAREDTASEGEGTRLSFNAGGLSNDAVGWSLFFPRWLCYYPRLNEVKFQNILKDLCLAKYAKDDHQD